MHDIFNDIVVIGRIVHKNNLTGVKVVDINTFGVFYIPIAKILSHRSSIQFANCTLNKAGLRGTKEFTIDNLNTYNKQLHIIKNGLLTEGEIIYRYTSVDCTQDAMINHYCKLVISGGISGAIWDPYSDQAVKHAELYYNEIRARNTDVYVIAERTNKSVDEIIAVKNYLFINIHNLET